MVELASDFGIEDASGIIFEIDLLLHEAEHIVLGWLCFFLLELQDAELDGLTFHAFFVGDGPFKNGDVLFELIFRGRDVTFSAFGIQIFPHTVEQSYFCVLFLRA
jgi:hypothetical protein